MTNTIAARYDFGLALIKEAGDLALSYFNKRETLTIASKGLQDMASEADLNTELLIKKRLEEVYPGDAFLGEETGATQFAEDQGIWVVDPIDGTQPFICGLSSWCVSIGFMQRGKVRFGMVYAPARNELFAGCEGRGATLNGKAISGSTALNLKQGLVSTGYSPRTPTEEYLPLFGSILKSGGMFYRDGSGALGLCYVACGKLIGYIEMHINSWDCLGAIAVLNGAGVKVNDFLAGDGLLKGNPIVAGNDHIHAELSALMNGARP